MRVTVKVLNVPDYAKKYKYMVVKADTTDPSKFWFFGAWNELADAKRVANDEYGYVMEVGAEE